MDEKEIITNKTSKNKIIISIIKWIFVLALLSFGYIYNADFFHESFALVMESPIWLIICSLILANIYYIAEGCIMKQISSCGEQRISIAQGIFSAYMCSFYRLATLGRGNGIAQLVYYNTKGIRIDRASGLSLVEYTIQKITIGFLGITAFIISFFIGNDASGLRQYDWYFFAGLLVNTLICLGLLLVEISATVSNIVLKIIDFVCKKIKRLNSYPEKIRELISNFQNQGRIILKNKKVLIRTCLLDIVKYSCWYLIPGIYFYHYYHVNIFLSLILMCIINMLAGVMLAPAGIGTFEFVFVIVFELFIRNDSSLAAAIVIYRFFTWIIPFIIGLIPALLLKKK